MACGCSDALRASRGGGRTSAGDGAGGAAGGVTASVGEPSPVHGRRRARPRTTPRSSRRRSAALAWETRVFEHAERVVEGPGLPARGRDRRRRRRGCDARRGLPRRAGGPSSPVGYVCIEPGNATLDADATMVHALARRPDLTERLPYMYGIVRRHGPHLRAPAHARRGRGRRAGPDASDAAWLADGSERRRGLPQRLLAARQDRGAAAARGALETRRRRARSPTGSRAAGSRPATSRTLRHGEDLVVGADHAPQRLRPASTPPSSTAAATASRPTSSSSRSTACAPSRAPPSTATASRTTSTSPSRSCGATAPSRTRVHKGKPVEGQGRRAPLGDPAHGQAALLRRRAALPDHRRPLAERPLRVARRRREAHAQVGQGRRALDRREHRQAGPARLRRARSPRTRRSCRRARRAWTIPRRASRRCGASSASTPST